MAIPRMSLGNSAIQALLQNKAALAEFPFLKSIPKVKSKSCGSCGGGGIKMVPDYNRIKKKISGLSGQSKVRLKRILNAAEIVMTFRSGTTTSTIRF
jgi:hypothetical protein